MSDSQKYIREGRERRQRTQAARQARADRLPAPSYYEGHDGITGRPIARISGGGGVPSHPLSNIQRSIGEQGRSVAGGFDLGSFMGGNGRGQRPQPGVGKIKVLIEVDRGDSQLEYWVGGHVKKPILIKKFGTTVLLFVARLDNVGLGKNDWIFAYKHSATEDTDTIGVMHGATPELNWELTSRQARQLLTTGAGFWSSVPQFVSNQFSTTNPINVQGPPIGSWTCSNVGRIGTCQSYALIGAALTENIAGESNSGVTEPSATDFPGTTNTLEISNTERRYWDGSYAGGSEPTVPEAYFEGIALAQYCGVNYFWREYTDAMVVLERIDRIDRDLSSPAYTYNAYEGAASALVGQYDLHRAAYRYQRVEQSHPTYIGHLITGLQTGSVEAACRLTKVAADGGPDRTIPALREESSSASVAKSVSVSIAPTVNKPFEFAASVSTSVFGADVAPFISTSYSPIQNANGTYLFRKNESSGSCIIGNGGEGILPGGSSVTTFYLFDTTERAVTFPFGTNPIAWRLKPVTSAPSKLTQVDLNTLNGVLSASLSGTINLLSDSGSGTYTASDPLQEKVYKIPFSADIASIIQADYYG